MESNIYVTSLIAGGVGGLVVDITLFPLDTLKTRLQSAQGFVKAGGFRGIYKGIGPQAIGSAPQAAFFFCSYEGFKAYTTPLVNKESLPLVYMIGASISEVVACLIRVPVEIVKQRRQTTLGNKVSSLGIFLEAYRTEGIIKGLYRGFGSTVLREIPFSLIQFPVWEYLQKWWSINEKNGQQLTPWEVAVCGAIAGGFSAAITTPLDVAKTRIMLADKRSVNTRHMTVLSVLKSVYREAGVKGLFSGIVPRTLWITLGGAVFFGTYDFAKSICNNHFASRSDEY